MRIRQFHMPIFWKFVVGILFVVAVFGIINIILIKNNVGEALHEESEKRGKYIAYSLAQQAVDPMLYEDYIALQKLVDNVSVIDKTVLYVFIQTGEPNFSIIHNFKQNLPHSLIASNKLEPGKSFSVKILTLKDEQEMLIRDVAVPILSNNIGVVRIGIKEDIIHANVNSTVYTMISMVSLFALLGIIGAFIFSKVITKPISEISAIAENLDFDKQREQNELIIMNKNRKPKRYRLKDELDFLNEKFYSMLNRLLEAYKELELTMDKLIQSEKMASIGTLASGVAHEINNPNAGIQNCIRRLKKDFSNKEQSEKYLELMEEASVKIEQVVRSLLDYSKPHTMAFDYIDINDVINKSISLIQYKFEKLNVAIEIKIPEIRSKIFASNHFLQQVFVNLLMNSIDAIEERKAVFEELEGKIKIEVVQNGSFTSVSVEDNGCGIKKEFLNNIYDPFYTSKEMGKGTGLGLSICHNILKSHNGAIEVDSVENQWAIFKVSIPHNLN